MPTKLFHLVSLFLCIERGGDVPGEVQVGATVQVELVFEHLVHGVCGSSIVWDLELGDLLLACVAG